MLKDIFKKRQKLEEQDEKTQHYQGEVPAGLWRKCNKCNSPIYSEDVRQGLYICPKCQNYFRMPARDRIRSLVDEGSFEEWNTEPVSSNPLKYAGYGRKKKETREKTGLYEAIITGKCRIGNYAAALGVMDASFFMGSMGYVVGEFITNTVERAIEERLPVILFTCSGGARMQEGIISLMQMAKTSAALKKHSDAGLLSVIVLTDPTTGGVTASFAMLGDIILAEPGALIGFAGPRVIEQTIRQKLPDGFQRSEFLLEHGFVDVIVPRMYMREYLSLVLEHHKPVIHSQEPLLLPAENNKPGVESKAASEVAMHVENVSGSNAVVNPEKEDPVSTPQVSAWERVLRSRDKNRATGLDYIQTLFHNFQEFHGDREFRDDPAIVGGIADFYGMPVTVIAQQKGKNTKDNLKRNFGMPSPDGYRKALRLMKQAEKFHRPVICFVDTPGAFCGLEAEERGQGEAIARNLYEMSAIKTPMLSIFIGEGGSGGALAMAVTDEVWMMENAVYSILSPEGFASILWKDSSRADEAAAVMKMTAADLKELGIVEKIIPEEVPVTGETLREVCQGLEPELSAFLHHYQSMDPQVLTEKRYQRFRKF